MKTVSNELFTAGEIARRVKVPLSSLDYILRSRQFRPIGRIGCYRLFDAETAQKITDEVRRVRTRRQRRSRPNETEFAVDQHGEKR